MKKFIFALIIILGLTSCSTYVPSYSRVIYTYNPIVYRYERPIYIKPPMPKHYQGYHPQVPRPPYRTNPVHSGRGKGPVLRGTR